MSMQTLGEALAVRIGRPELAHCHGQPVGRLILRPRRKFWVACAMLDALMSVRTRSATGPPGCSMMACQPGELRRGRHD